MTDRDPFASAPEPRTQYPDVVVGIAVVSAVAAAFAGAAPTGLGWWDAVLRAGLAGVVTLAASGSSRWTWMVLAGVTTAFSALSIWIVVAAVAFGLAIWGALGSFRDPIVGAVVGALAMQSLLRLPQNWFFGFESLLAMAVIAPVLMTGYQRARRRARRRARAACKIGGGVALVLVVCAVVVVLAGRGPAQAGVSAAQVGLDSARSGDVTATLADLQSAQRAFIDADKVFGAPWAAPARLLPIAGQHLRILGTASQEGRLLAESAAAAVQNADFDQISLDQGRVDVGLLAGMAPDLEQLASSMVDARFRIQQDRSPWLIAAVDRRLDSLVADLERAIPETDLAAGASRSVPALLGSGGAKRYLVVFGSPSESRELGGYMGSFALIEAVDGQLRKVTSGRPGALYEVARSGVLDDPAGYPAIFVEQDPVKWPQNLTGMPQITEVARAARDVFPVLEGAPIDGVVYLDPYAVAAMLELTGPVTVEGVGFALDSTNVADFLTKDQYALFPSVDDRFDFLNKVLDATFAALTTSSLPGPERLGAVFGPIAREGRIQVATFDEQANDFLRRVFLLQEFPEPGTSDFLSVVAANGTQNKLDSYVQREVIYRIVTDHEAGKYAGEVQIDLTLDAPADVAPYVLGPEEFRGDLTTGDHQILLSIYTPHIVEFAAVDGVNTLFGEASEFGYNRYQVPVILSIGGPTQATVRFSFAGVLPPSDGYSLIVANQPNVNRDIVQVEITHGPTGESAATRIELDQDLSLQWTPADQ